ncbi:MAG: hypothetical protein V2I79_08890 [Xanthomonadales bacterium]|jgi:hypothetical protein|nr:hypothetical protein [Xanthomonadales bacterium]
MIKLKIFLVVLLLFVSMPAVAEQLVREFSGSRTMQTPEFEVEAPWLIDWRVNSEYRDSMGLTIVLLNEPSQTHAGTVMKTKYVGDGLRLFEEGGRFSLKVDSVLSNWTIKVIQLTPEEAEQYTPKEKGLL